MAPLVPDTRQIHSLGVREQSQIFGRTCRNGAHGSVQLVLLVPEAAKEARHLQPFLVLQLLMQGRCLSSNWNGLPRG